MAPDMHAFDAISAQINLVEYFQELPFLEDLPSIDGKSLDKFSGKKFHPKVKFYGYRTISAGPRITLCTGISYKE